MSFSINLYDNDGDCMEECLLIHLDNGTILSFKTIGDLEKFSKMVNNCLKEIKDEFPEL
jgi:hypothetical protein